MTARPRNHSGFTLIEVLLVAAVLAIVGALGYVFFNRMNSPVAVNTNSMATDVQGAPDIKQAGDLDKAADVLSETDPATSDSDLNDLESMASGF